jgi:hypothetical protein
MNEKTLPVPANCQHIRFAADLAVLHIGLPVSARFIHDRLIPFSTTSALESGFDRHLNPCQKEIPLEPGIDFRSGGLKAISLLPDPAADPLPSAASAFHPIDKSPVRSDPTLVRNAIISKVK